MRFTLLAPWLPLLLSVPIALVARWIANAKVTLAVAALWPENENPALAIQLAASASDADRILGTCESESGRPNRDAVVIQQQRDFLFIGLYVAFFWAISVSRPQVHPLLSFATCAAAVLAGFCDTFEDLKIIQLCDNGQGSPRPFALAKWTLFFAALTLAAACLAFSGINALDKQLLSYAVGAVALASSVFGVIATIRSRIQDLATAVKLSACAMAALAILPLILKSGNSLSDLIEQTMLMRVPLLCGLALFTLPFIARYTSASALLLGLFDISPWSTIPVALAAAFVAGAACDNMRIIFVHSRERIWDLPPIDHASLWWFWLALTALLSLPVIVAAVGYSNRQNGGDLGKRSLCALGALTASLSVQFAGGHWIKPLHNLPSLAWVANHPSLRGYYPLDDHASAAVDLLFALSIYLIIGFYGFRRLGKRRTVPALCSALMLLMLICSGLSALSFFLDVWHVPLLLAIALVGIITAQSSQSDHLYELLQRHPGAGPAPTPIETVQATKVALNGRIILVAANGGGIQAAAWTAQVLEGLCQVAPGRFADSLRLISSVSGGSLGSACYAYRQAEPDNARRAADAASRSSLDEVAWGLGWPDFIRSLFPWVTRGWIGRGRALERAWIMNCSSDEAQPSDLNKALSDWNWKVGKGDMPALIMNATIVETGQRVLLGTTCFSGMQDGRARVDASTLHGATMDVAVVTAARLSASFPYVTPASRSTLPGPQLHVVDGGYYDNYGMSTLVEWLDEALDADRAQPQDQRSVKSVLVIQIHGSPVDVKSQTAGSRQDRGWFFQLLAPLLTLNSVRGAGQIAHNDLELDQLQEKWFERGMPIHSVTFEFPDDNAPLSWHLTREQQERIYACWVDTAEIAGHRQQVRSFLDGSDNLRCHCPTCNSNVLIPSVAKAATP